MGALLLRAADPKALLVLAHGAGAPMTHPFMEQVAMGLATAGVSTLRYQFPYTEKGARRPDPQPVLLATVRSAVEVARVHADDLPLLAGGKSMGGRMTSLAASDGGLEGVERLVFLGFPLHPAGKPSVDRAAHLEGVDVPMLFLQGTRDALADLTLLAPIVERLPQATMHVVDGADHGFHVLKRSGRTDDEVLAELVSTTAAFVP